MHVMRNLGKWKKPISRIFVVSASAGSFFGLVQPFYVVCTFYHILLFYLSHAYRYFLCYALPNRFVCNSFIPVSIYAPLYNISCCVLWFTVCGCGWSFQLIFVWTWLSMFLPESSEDAPVWLLTAYIVNYKDPWQHPVKPDRAMGLWTVLNVLCRFKYRLINRRFSHQILPRYLPGSHPVQRP